MVLGAALLLVGAAVPAHLRAMDIPVLEAAARGSSGGATLLGAVDGLLGSGRPGPAGLLLEAARVRGAGDLDSRMESRDKARRDAGMAARWGLSAELLDRHLGRWVKPEEASGRPVLGWILRAEVREALRRALSASTDPSATALLACRSLEGTRILPAVNTAAGQPMDAALMLAGGLVLAGRMHAGLALDFERASVAARQGRGTERLEKGLLDLLGGARHLDWDQLGWVVEASPTLEIFHALVSMAGGGGENWPLLAAAIAVDGGAGRVGAYLARHGSDGLADLQLADRLGDGAVRELLMRGLRVERRSTAASLAGWAPAGEVTRRLADLSWRAPRGALLARYLVVLDGLFLVLLGLWHGRQATRAEVNRRFEPRPDYGVLLVVAVTAGILLFLVSERYVFARKNLSEAASAVALPALKLRLRTDIPHVTSSAMNEKIIGMLVVFFAIQFAIYLVGLGRLRHIRGRPVEDSVKLRLLDNEESMFDAPLYLGIAGSVLALVLRLTGFDEVSLMASYSSTLFGILFCFLLKVVHVRPYRQQLILESSARGES